MESIMAKKIKPVRVTTFSDNAKITVLKPYEAREGSNVARVFAMVAKSKTIAQYKSLRAKNKLSGVGGMLAGFIAAGHVRVSVK
jgi:hypothetical protein